MVLHSAVFSRRRLAKARYACYDLEPYIVTAFKTSNQ